MPASRLNYVVVYKGESQLYGAASKGVALNGPLPDGADIEDKIVLFSTFNPDTANMSVHRLDEEEVRDGYKEWLVKEAEKEEKKAKKEVEKALNKGVNNEG